MFDRIRDGSQSQAYSTTMLHDSWNFVSTLKLRFESVVHIVVLPQKIRSRDPNQPTSACRRRSVPVPAWWHRRANGGLRLHHSPSTGHMHGLHFTCVTTPRIDAEKVQVFCFGKKNPFFLGDCLSSKFSLGMHCKHAANCNISC